MIGREQVHELQVDLLALKQHLVESRGLDPHDVESLRRDILDRCSRSSQHVAAAALCAVLHQQLELVDRARPGLPLR